MSLPATPLHPAAIEPGEAEAGGVLTIDLAAIAANWKRLYGITVPVECAAVVKADAYGCGLARVVPALSKVGCRTFFVADIAEARRVRALAPEAVIYVLNGLMPNTAPAYAELNLRPVINSTTELAEWDSFVAAGNWEGGAALHIDTGMNRLGLTPEEAVAVAQRVQAGQAHGFKLLMSHLACADTPSHSMNERQLRLFREIRILFRGVPSSLANSAGIFLGGHAHCDLVRPGIALYGGNPIAGQSNPMRPAIELKGRITLVRQVKKGDSVGYGGGWTAARASRIATVAAGYGDGYLRAAAAGKGKAAAAVIVAGKPCPLVGPVSMDVLTVDVTDLPAGAARRGEFATLIGGALSIDELGAACGTIGYEILTALGRRYHRIYRG
ncbi:MAG: alanine racemase [Hyphomicrobiales bacterium]|nr:alanine racemase [Hyphomicrobiales bacterium]